MKNKDGGRGGGGGDLKGWEVEERGRGYATMLKPLKKDTREEAIKGG